jgi:hypothetical protein
MSRLMQGNMSEASDLNRQQRNVANLDANLISRKRDVKLADTQSLGMFQALAK